MICTVKYNIRNIFLALLGFVSYNAHMTETTQNPEIPETVSPAGISPLHPLSQAGAAIHQCLNPMSENVAITDLAYDLESALNFERIYDYGDNALLLTTHSRTLDAIFNRFVIQGFAPDQNPDLNKIRIALMAQRQCTTVIDKLQRRKNRKY